MYLIISRIILPPEDRGFRGVHRERGLWLSNPPPFTGKTMNSRIQPPIENVKKEIGPIPDKILHTPLTEVLYKLHCPLIYNILKCQGWSKVQTKEMIHNKLKSSVIALKPKNFEIINFDFWSGRNKINYKGFRHRFAKQTLKISKLKFLRLN